jgi:predicted signal transduction protein with EAL and GGDEF domain
VSADVSPSEIGDYIPPIAETDPHVLRARKTAAWTRAALGTMGIALICADAGLLAHPSLAIVGFAVILVSSVVQLSAPSMSWMRTEESLAGVAGLLIIGLQSQRVSVISIVWLAAVASGVLARGGRVHWIGRTVVLSALGLPILRSGHLSLEYAALAGATIGLLLTSGRLTRELNHLLHQARYDADHDDLTGLLSYAAFRAVLEQTVESSQRSAPVSLLLLDLERFGIVNKTHCECVHSNRCVVKVRSATAL